MPQTRYDSLDELPPELWELLTRAIDGMLRLLMEDHGEEPRERLEALAKRLLD